MHMKKTRNIFKVQEAAEHCCLEKSANHPILACRADQQGKTCE